jgi:hypothetical protein
MIPSNCGYGAYLGTEYNIGFRISDSKQPLGCQIGDNNVATNLVPLVLRE